MTLVLLISENGFSAEKLIPLAKINSRRVIAKTYVLVIGVSVYKDSFWPKLKWADKDAERVGEEFSNGILNQKVVVRLQNSEATLKNVLNELEKLKKKATPQDEVIIYFSGHGTLELGPTRDLQKITVLHDTDHAKIWTTGLRHSVLYDYLTSVSANKKLLVLATCHSGVGKSKMSKTVEEFLSSIKSRIAPIESVSEGLVVLSASAKSETAREDSRLKGDIYTHFLIEGLSVYDRDKDGAVSALEAHDYAKVKTYNFTGGRQRPTAVVSLVGEGDLVLKGSRRRSPLPVLAGYDGDYAGLEVLVNSKEKGVLPLGFALKTGTNTVQFSNPETKEVSRYALNTSEGERISVEDILRPAPYQITMGSYLSGWNNSAMKTLRGGAIDLQFQVGVMRVYKFLRFGFNFEASTPSEVNVRSGLNASSLFTRQYLSAGIGIFKNISLYAHLGVEQAKISFTDDVASAELTYFDSALLYGARLEWVVWSRGNKQLYIQTSQSLSHHEFSQIGNISSNQTGYLGIGFNLNFGGKAKKL